MTLALTLLVSRNSSGHQHFAGLTFPARTRAASWPAAGGAAARDANRWLGSEPRPSSLAANERFLTTELIQQPVQAPSQ